MVDWIIKLFEQLLHSLDDSFEIVNLSVTLQSIGVFEQIDLTKEQLMQTKIMEYMNDLYVETPNQYMKYRLELLLKKWHNVVQGDRKKTRHTKRVMSNSVFEAVIKDDDRFFKTKSVPELLHRLLKSFDKNYKVIDMATVLNTIDTFEKINIPVTQLATTHLVTYVRRLRRNTTNKYLSNRLRHLLRKWRNLVQLTEISARKLKA